MQCLHQHTPLSDLIVQLNGQKGIVAEYLTYKAHVCRQIYANPDLADTRTAELESEWPEYPKSTTLLPVRAYLTSGAQQHVPVPDRPSDLNEGRAWLREYLEEDVQQKHEHRQHHIHIPNDDGTRIPLAHAGALTIRSYASLSFRERNG